VISPIRTIRHLPLVMDDGVTLSATVLLPDGHGRWSAILDAVPYRKDDDFRALDHATYAPIAARGLACVRLDLRGSGSSLGILEGEYLERELRDLEQAIALIAEQPWCTGRVGLTGVSWGGFNAVQVAMRRPPALAAIAPIHFSIDRMRCDVHYAGGSLQVHEAVAWPGSMVAEMALPPDPAIVGEGWEAIWRDRLERTPAWPLQTLAHQRRDAYWRHGSACEDWASIDVPVLAIGGWRDGYRDACLAVLEHVQAPRRAVIGPWGHARPHAGAPGPAFDHRVLLARWFDRWCNGTENGVDAEPALVVYQGERWRAFRRPSRRSRAFQLGAGTLGDAPGAEPRTWSGPASTGHRAPWWCPNGGEPLGRPGDMRRDDATSLCYDTAPLDVPLELLGGATLEVTVVADRPVAQVAARLEHVRPDGQSTLLARGGRNLTRRSSDEAPTPLVPGEPVTVTIRIAACGTTIPTGHRLRLALAGADWPIMWPAPQPFRLTVVSGSLTATIVDAEDEVAAPPMALPEPRVDDGALHDGPPTTWTVERDLATGLVRSRTTGGWRTTFPDGVLTAGSDDVTCTVSHDGTTCSAVAANTAEVRLGPAHALARSTLSIHSDAAAFHVAIALAVEREGEVVFSRAWEESFPRDLM
jgi:putative CocE/NonD family hydrolase